jgi:hypothetical protein
VTLVLFSLVLGIAGPVTSNPDESRSVAVAVGARLRSLNSDSLWPGFEPSKVPLAIFDGENTYLFRHPHPPPEFRPAADLPETAIAQGRHPLVRANTSISLGGVRTATLLLDGPDKTSVGEAAILAVHEAFHVFQADRHPKWSGNEADLFTYPTDDPMLVQLSRLETESLRRALAARDLRSSACWTAAALELRKRRFAALGEAGALYERGTELKEGLARLVENRARGTSPPEPVIPKEDFAPGDVRSRSYAVGHAFGVLLDRFERGWEARLESGGEKTLDGLLAEALTSESERRPCRFRSQETSDALARAKRSVEITRMTRAAIRDEFFSRSGWTIVVVAAAEPLSPQGFDPLNVERLGPGEVLHSRWIKLGNSAGSLEVLNARAITESAGSHPLFEGVRRVTVTGIRDEPDVRESAEAIELKAAGVTAQFNRARWERKDRTITVFVSKGP